jgi:hypothetical protein
LLPGRIAVSVRTSRGWSYAWAIEEFHRRLPEYAINPGQRLLYPNYGVRAAVRLPISFPPV